ncbi:NADH-ubiquinone oxidoreductase chain 4 [Cyphomyrmex costatus]|uniref:NADH-ubiquinone oxidoreductase chain 4 n=1 Tax=Cyphomyrmex costatus TaxID=456900 RepID=A0A151I9S7_9HYME|nr:NADH-ubiquinone oxidoreductase chain 4 [Cyphomyrmex costatus]
MEGATFSPRSKVKHPEYCSVYGCRNNSNKNLTVRFHNFLKANKHVVYVKRIVAYSSVVHINLILRRIITLTKIGILSSYITIVAHGLCSSGMFYLVNLFYKRSGRRLLFLNKGLVRNIPNVII